MARFADVIYDSRGVQPTVEKLRCIRATKEMISIAKNHISIGLPQVRPNFLIEAVCSFAQICACLQLALDSDNLRDTAFSTWYAMIMVLDEDDLESLIGGTFSIVVRHWSSLGKESQDDAYNLLNYLFSNHGPRIACFVDSLPSLSSIPSLSIFEVKLQQSKANVDVRQQFSGFAIRCQHENATIVGQALQELTDFLQIHQTFLHEAAISEQSDPILATLVRAVLDACTRLSTIRPDVAKLGGQCLGLIGCVDPNRVEASRENQNMLVLSNFQRADETIDFLTLFLEQHLVKSFLSATSIRAQGFYAYAMQELLKFCGLSKASTIRTRDTHPDMNYRRWIALPEAVRNTLAPFLDSRYTISGATKSHPTFPIYNPSVSHATWLRMFLLNLMEHGAGDNVELLFPVISRAVQPQETTVANFLLPFVVLNVILGGKDEKEQRIKKEMLTVLKQQPQSESSEQTKNLRLCSEVSLFCQRTFDYFLTFYS
jgi:serine/threonine-protein kinase ATR